MKIHKLNNKNKTNHKYNWQPDLPDQRDFMFFLKIVAPIPMLPSKIDLRPQCSPIVNQGKIGSCTGNALAGNLEFLELQQMKTKTTTDDTQVFCLDSFTPFSRLFIYYNERLIEGKVDQDSGATIRDGIKSLVKWGSCSEKTWKYTQTNVFTKPTLKAYKEAKPHNITSYLRIESTNEMKQCLASGFPFVFGFAVYESFESPQVARTGVMPMPSITERMLGGHAVMAVGYDDTEKYFIIRNSWGPEWGDKGYFKMPYDYISNSNLTADFWTVRR